MQRTESFKHASAGKIAGHFAIAGAAVAGGIGVMAGSAGLMASATAARVSALVAPAGAKLGQMIGRWKNELGGSGGREEFMRFAQNFADHARSTGQSISGTVGQLQDATIYRSGSDYLVVDAANKMRSFVANARAGEGIAKVYESLGGK